MQHLRDALEIANVCKHMNYEMGNVSIQLTDSTDHVVAICVSYFTVFILQKSKYIFYIGDEPA